MAVTSRKPMIATNVRLVTKFNLLTLGDVPESGKPAFPSGSPRDAMLGAEKSEQLRSKLLLFLFGQRLDLPLVPISVVNWGKRRTLPSKTAMGPGVVP
jgi:hypothetical protein